MEKHKLTTIIYNCVIIAFFLVGATIVFLQFVHLGNVEFTDNARVRQHITPQNTRVQGFIREIRFTEFQPVHKGDTLVMFTDGITEAMNTQLQEFGEDRLVATLEKLTQSNCQQVVDGIKADVATFVGEAEQSDDITILVLKRK